MAIKIPNTWMDTDYSRDSQVYYNGVGYQSNTSIETGDGDPVDNSKWDVYAVFRITEWYSLQEAVEFAINSDNTIINSSIPLYIQNVERFISNLLRSPAQKVTQVFTVDSDSKFEIPGDLLEVYHLRLNRDSGVSYTLEDRGAITMQAADRTTFEEVRQAYTQNGYFQDNWAVDFPVYRNDDQYFYIAPGLPSGTEVELTYYQEVPELGSTVALVNSNGQAINDSDETLAEWIAEGNDPADFVQATEIVTSNLWTATTPQLLKAGACAEAEKFLENTGRAELWMEQFQEILQSTQIEFKKFETNRSTSIQQATGYVGG